MRLSAILITGLVTIVASGCGGSSEEPNPPQAASTSTGEAATSANPAAGTDLEDLGEALLKEGYTVSQGGEIEGEQAFAISKTKKGAIKGIVAFFNNAKTMTDVAKILYRNFRRDPGDFYYEIHASTNPVEDLLAEKSGQYYLWRVKNEEGVQPVPRAQFSRLVRDLVPLSGCGRCVVQMADNLPGGQRVGIPRP
jgi:hypothetical protein